MDTPYQPTGSGKRIWRQPLRRDVVEFGTLPDQRDARIAQLEAALREIGYEIEQWSDDVREAAIYYTSIGEIVSRALMPPPEGDMALTVEELPA